jgi:hypothetical protein
VFEDLLEEGNFEEGAGGGGNRFVRSIKTGPRRMRSWVSFEEAIQTILRAQCDILIADFGFPAQTTQLVGKLWFHYLASTIPSHRSKTGAQNAKARVRRDAIKNVRKEHLKMSNLYLLKPLAVLKDIAPNTERIRRRAAAKHPFVPLKDISSDDDAPEGHRLTANGKYLKLSLSVPRSNTRGTYSSSEWSGSSEASDDTISLSSSSSSDIPMATQKKTENSRRGRPPRNRKLSGEGSDDNAQASRHSPSASSAESIEELSDEAILIDSSDASDGKVSSDSDSEDANSSSDVEGEFPKNAEKVPVLEDDLPDFIVPKQRGAHYTTLMRESLTLHLTLEILYIAILYLRVPVLPGDLVEWAATGKLPYLTAYQLLPTSMSYYRYLKPYSIPSTNVLVKKALRLASDLKLESPIPPLNQFPLLSRMATLLEVAPEVERAAIRLMKLSKWEASFGPGDHPYNLVFAHLLMAIKLLYQFNDTYGLSEVALTYPNITAKCLPEWLNEQFQLEKRVAITTPWGRHELEQFPNTSIEAYVDFLKYQHTDKMRLNPEIAELQTMFDCRSQGQSLHRPITPANEPRNLGHGGLVGPDGEDAAARLPCEIDYGPLRAYFLNQPDDEEDENGAAKRPEAFSSAANKANADEGAGTKPKKLPIRDAPGTTPYVTYHEQYFGITHASHEYLINKGARLLATTRHHLLGDLFRIERRIFGIVQGWRKTQPEVTMHY